MERPMNDDLENTRGDKGRMPKKIWCTPVLIIADVSISGSAKTTVAEVSNLVGTPS